jgi:hypothetical protein
MEAMSEERKARTVRSWNHLSGNGQRGPGLLNTKKPDISSERRLCGAAKRNRRMLGMHQRAHNVATRVR